MKPRLFCMDWNGVIPDLSDEFEILDSGAEVLPDAVLLWNDVLPTMIDIVKNAQMNGIPAFCMQHGIHGDPGLTEYTEHQKKPVSDYIFTWSDKSGEVYEREGWKKDRIVNIGCTLLRYELPATPDGKTVIFAPDHLEDDPARNIANLEKAKQIWKEIREIPGIRPIVKLLTAEHSNYDPARGINFDGNVVWSDRRDGPLHVKKMFEILSNASCVVVQEESTFSSMACKLDIPVISINEKESRLKTSTEVKVEGVKEAVVKMLKEPWTKREERNSLVKDYVQPFNREKMVGFMKSVINSKLAVA